MGLFPPSPRLVRVGSAFDICSAMLAMVSGSLKTGPKIINKVVVNG